MVNALVWRRDQFSAALFLFSHFATFCVESILNRNLATKNISQQCSKFYVLNVKVSLTTLLVLIIQYLLTILQNELEANVENIFWKRQKEILKISYDFCRSQQIRDK